MLWQVSCVFFLNSLLVVGISIYCFANHQVPKQWCFTEYNEMSSKGDFLTDVLCSFRVVTVSICLNVKIWKNVTFFLQTCIKQKAFVKENGVRNENKVLLLYKSLCIFYISLLFKANQYIILLSWIRWW